MGRRPDGSYDYGYFDTSNMSPYSYNAESQRKKAADDAAAASARWRREAAEAEEKRRRDQRIADEQRRIAVEAAQRRANEIARANARTQVSYVSQAPARLTLEQHEYNLAIAAWNNTTLQQRRWIGALVVDLWKHWLETDQSANHYIAACYISGITQAVQQDRYRDGTVIPEILRCHLLWKTPGAATLLAH